MDVSVGECGTVCGANSAVELWDFYLHEDHDSGCDGVFVDHPVAVVLLVHRANRRVGEVSGGRKGAPVVLLGIRGELCAERADEGLDRRGVSDGHGADLPVANARMAAWMGARVGAVPVEFAGGVPGDCGAVACARRAGQSDAGASDAVSFCAWALGGAAADGWQCARVVLVLLHERARAA